MRVLILGRGKVGRTLHAALRGAMTEGSRGLSSVKLRPSRMPGRVHEADLIVLAVPDDAIEEIATQLRSRLQNSASVLHCAGARSSEELRAVKNGQGDGPSIGAMHPMVSFASARRHPSLRDASFVISGERAARQAAAQLARAVHARPVQQTVHGPAYHAAAALVANGTAALASSGIRVLTHLGMGTRQATQTIAGLLRSVAQNVEQIGVPEALTGPIMRGDGATVKRHREALSSLPEVRETYEEAAPSVLRCAREAGLPSDAVRRIRRALRADLPTTLLSTRTKNRRN